MSETNMNQRKRDREDTSASESARARGPLRTQSNANIQNNAGNGSASSASSLKTSAQRGAWTAKPSSTVGAPGGTARKGSSNRSSVASSTASSTGSAASRNADVFGRLNSGHAKSASGGGGGDSGAAQRIVTTGRNGPVPPRPQPGASNRSNAARSGPTCMQPQPPPPPPPPAEPAVDPEHTMWAVKRSILEAEVQQLTATHDRLRRDKDAVLDAIEGMLRDYESTKSEFHAVSAQAKERHEARLKAIAAQEDACLVEKQRALMQAEALTARVTELATLKDEAQEAIVLEQDRNDELRKKLEATRASVKAHQDQLAALKLEEEKMQDASYGLSGEVKEMVVAMESLAQQQRKAEVAAMETEITRRELYSKCEELKGSIRVFCRVKGSKAPTMALTEIVPSTDVEGADADGETEGGSGSSPATPGLEAMLSTPALSPSREGRSVRGSTASTSTTASVRRGPGQRGPTNGSRRAQAVGNKLAHPPSSPRDSETGSTVTTAWGEVDGLSAEGGCADEIYSFPDGANTHKRRTPKDTERANEEAEDDADYDEFALPRTITVHQSRQNATSTGKHNTTDTFNFDYVFDHHASQTEVYHEVEPLVNSAIDGYRVCIFAYGQTGSGKTYTMEGSLATEETHGIIPRALASIFERQEALGKEGWSYTLTCSLVEIYNDVIRDLQQSPSIYDSNHGSGPSAAASSSVSYHTIKHQGENTVVSNVKLTKLTSMEDFRKVYRLATQHRRTARTQLNERSSRSHCIFTLNIDGVNQTIRQKSSGTLCLVDLAGSERVNDSGVQGQQFKEAVNINKSLLDLGKCIHAMRGGTVAPWRNCKLTYLLQNYLGAKGGKMLMLVNISDRRQHLAESVNSLRFATRVSETVIGQSVKRVTSF